MVSVNRVWFSSFVNHTPKMIKDMRRVENAGQSSTCRRL